MNDESILTLIPTDVQEIQELDNERVKKIRKMIRHELKYQNGRMCSHPQYCVMEVVRVGGDSSHRCSEGEPVEIMREIFFTNKEAQQYIEENKYDHDGELFIYVKSGYENEGWQLARELMMEEAQ